MTDIKIHNVDCIEYMKNMEDESVDLILTDPPYQYLKHKLDVCFDEDLFFNECYRVLSKNGMIVAFGRGTSFYRWNVIMDEVGFNFKEEVIWDKRQTSSPLLPIMRIHETISIHSKGKGKIRKVRVPYVEMKRHNMNSVIADVKRIKSALNNPKSFNAMLNFLENNKMERTDLHTDKHLVNMGKGIKDVDRSVMTLKTVQGGKVEESIIRTDREKSDTFTKHNVTTDKRKSGDRATDTIQSICVGMNEKSIIYENREHYKFRHPTQKPVRLLERLMNIASDKGSVVFDPFMGSGSTGIAAKNTGRNFIGCEIDEEYFNIAKERISQMSGLF